VEAEFRKIEQDGVVLWVPSFMEFKNNEILIVQRGFLWSAYLMLVGVLSEADEACCNN
jgi:hypothetical protein